VCSYKVGLFRSMISTSNDSSTVETADVLHLDQYNLLIASFHKKEFLKNGDAYKVNLLEVETRNCYGKV